MKAGAKGKLDKICQIKANVAGNSPSYCQNI